MNYFSPKVQQIDHTEALCIVQIAVAVLSFNQAHFFVPILDSLQRICHHPRFPKILYLPKNKVGLNTKIKIVFLFRNHFYDF